MKKYTVKRGGLKNWQVMDDVGNIVARCVWQNAARRITKLLNADQ